MADENNMWNQPEEHSAHADAGDGSVHTNHDGQDAPSPAPQMPENKPTEVINVNAVEEVIENKNGSEETAVLAEESDTENDSPRKVDNAHPQETETTQVTEGTYRLAPQYGAYAPERPQGNEGQQNGQAGYNAQHQSPHTPFGAFNAQHQPPQQPYGSQHQPGQRNPYGQPGPNVGQNGQNPNGPFSTTPPRHAQHRSGAYMGGPNGAPNGNPNMGGPNGPTGPMGPNNPNNPYGGNGPMNRPQYAKTPSNIIVAVVAALVSAAICLGVGYAAITNGWISGPAASNIAGLTSRKSGDGSAIVQGGEAPNWPQVSKDVSMSVVAIQTQLDAGGAQGSGAILDKEGHIITNNHVINGAKKIQVNLDNGDMYSAQIVGTDKTTDLAVIKLDNPPANLEPIEFANSDDLAPGEAVMAIGNPLGYDGTATTGIVSALNRPVSVMDDDNTEIVTNAIQIDAAVNPGNSGGPTFNAAGKVIGINSSIASTATSSSTAGSIGIGFAIPANLAKRVSDEIIKSGKVQHVALGVSITNATATADGVTRGGAEVKSVVPDSPAAKAGVKVGDVIVGFNGVGVNNNYSLLGFVRAAAMGSTAKLTVVRDGKSFDLNVTFDKAESSVNGSNKQENNNQNNPNDQKDQNQGNDNDDSRTPEQRNPNDENGDNGGLIDPFGQW